MMIKNIITSIFRKIIFVGVALGVLMLVGYCMSDKKDYPGKTEFSQANDLIDTNKNGSAFGDSDETRTAAASFSKSMKSMQAVFFSGGSGKSFASGGEFVTYIKRNPHAVVVICHVPELRNYKDEAREALAKMAGAGAQATVGKIPGVSESDTLILGLRGFASYGPIWSGTVSGKATEKTGEADEVRRLYPFFAPDTPTPAP